MSVNLNTKPMKCFLLFFICFFSISFAAFSQEKLTKHTVAKGETVVQIAQQYKISPAEIYRLNPDAQNGIKSNMVLLIQNSLDTKAVKRNTKPIVNIKDSVGKTHVVLPKETVFGLAKAYNVTVDDLEKANPEIAKQGLVIGGTIKIPSELDKSDVKAETKSGKPKIIAKTEIIYHSVMSKETKYSIAKMYDITVENLEKANPEIKEGLQIGFRLKIVGGKSATALNMKAEESIAIKPVEKNEDLILYDVKAKETLYSLSKKFEINQDELFRLNPSLKNGVKEGMTLKFPLDIVINEVAEKKFSPLAIKLKTQDAKKLVMLLPFNISKIESDTVNSTISRLKTDKFLNMTLDFYSGALMAIDSAKTLGLNVQIQILDSQETKNTSNVVALIEQNNIEKADVVIGPFYQNNVEKTAELLIKNDVFIISPLSKETSKSYKNLILATPTNEMIKNAMFDFLREKSGNIVAVIDPKKGNSKKFITQKNKDIKFIPMDATGKFTADSIAIKLVKNKMNYVILDSEKTGMILKTINFLITLSKDYQVQLVILEKNETLDFEEIPLAKLAKLKMLYPSLTNENETVEKQVFEREFKEKNKVFPNQFATRGFDITFDTLLRLSQEKSFAATLDSDTTQQVDGKFDYDKKNPADSFSNKGIYILYYDTDLSVKIAQ
jgi:LysM repeat protein